MERKPLTLKTYQFFHAEDGSHLLIELQTAEGIGFAFPMTADYARLMGAAFNRTSKLT
jgi:hypothetical protein